MIKGKAVNQAKHVIFDIEAAIAEIDDSLNKNDIESVMMRFGHGDCHDLTRALSLKYNLPCMMVVGMGGMPVHSFVVLDGLALDAYGLNPLETVLARYSALWRLHAEEDVRLTSTDVDTLDFWSRPIFDDDDHTLAEFQILLDFMGLTLTRH